jgi:hypothetical protein
MKLVFSDLFEASSSSPSGLRQKMVAEAIQMPSSREHLQLAGGKELLFVTKCIEDAANGLVALFYGDFAGDTLTVLRGFKLYPDLHLDLHTLSPLAALEALADRFGMPMTIGPETRRFFVSTNIQIAATDAQNLNQVIRCSNPENHPIDQEALIRTRKTEDVFIVEIALAFCIDKKEYDAWVVSH